MDIDKFIQLYPAFIPQDICKLIITNFDKDEHEGKVIDGVVTGDGHASYRSDEFLVGKDIHMGNVKSWKQINEMLHLVHVNNAVNQYLKDVKPKYISSALMHPENCIISRYHKGKGHFAPHQDSTIESNYLRSLTVIMYLNDVKEGGETEFFNFQSGNENLKIKPSEGDILIFPSNFVYAHKGNIPVSNDKYIIVTFIEIEIRP